MPPRLTHIIGFALETSFTSSTSSSNTNM
jgi:hypothetical protein